jgi:hypothetical protein
LRKKWAYVNDVYLVGFRNTLYNSFDVILIGWDALSLLTSNVLSITTPGGGGGGLLIARAAFSGKKATNKINTKIVRL